MSNLQSSVGVEPIIIANKRIHAPYNSKNDVLQVQKLLNKSFSKSPGFIKLKEDGTCGKKTISAIKQFQTAFVKGIYADGLVEKSGRTYQTLTNTSTTSENPTITAFLKKHSETARSVAKKWGIPASVLLAQAAHESGWGRHVKDNAFFGIKGKSPTGNSVTFKTSEYVEGKKTSLNDSFIAYKNFEEAADDYGRFLTSNARYKRCFSTTNAEQFVRELASAGYATDPRYAEKILNTINKNGLTKYDQ